MPHYVCQLDRTTGLSVTLEAFATLPEALDRAERIRVEGGGRDIYVRAGIDNSEIAERLDAIADDMRTKTYLVRSGDRIVTYGDALWWRDETARIAVALDPHMNQSRFVEQ